MAVAAGGTFALCLTASGRVLVWGKLGGGTPSTPALAAGTKTMVAEVRAAFDCDAVCICNALQACLLSCAAGLLTPLAAVFGAQSHVLPCLACQCAQVQGLPPITSLSAGQQHALLSDGERVWAIGRWLNAAGDEAGMASWEAPVELLHLPADGVSKVVAGSHSSGVIAGAQPQSLMHA